MRTRPGGGLAPAPRPRASMPRVPNAPDAPRTIVRRSATPEAWAAYQRETAAASTPPAGPSPWRRPSLRGVLALGLGTTVVVLALVLTGLGMVARTSAATAPWIGAEPSGRHAGGPTAGPGPSGHAIASQPFPGRVGADVRQVVSVVAPDRRSRTATLQRWSRSVGGNWLAVGRPARVALGTGGLTWTPSDQRPQTPVGTWALDVVLARDRHITRMPEHVLRPGDGWSSCLTCADYDRLARTGELWAGRNSWARVAIHLVTNPRRIPGRSSGIFLHVGTSGPTAGCIGASPADALAVARWLDPAAHPRIVVAAHP